MEAAFQADVGLESREAAEIALERATPFIEAAVEERMREEIKDRFEDCDNCQHTVPKDDLETIWCREPESGEQVDARICVVCRLKAEFEQNAARCREGATGKHPGVGNILTTEAQTWDQALALLGQCEEVSDA